jgi:hypothetical protein
MGAKKTFYCRNGRAFGHAQFFSLNSLAKNNLEFTVSLIYYLIKYLSMPSLPQFSPLSTQISLNVANEADPVAEVRALTLINTNLLRFNTWRYCAP